MNEYLGIFYLWPLLLAAGITFLIVKSFFFRNKNVNHTINIISSEFIAETLKPSINERQIDDRTKNWINKARKVRNLINNFGEYKVESLNNDTPIPYLDLNNWLKISLGWTTVWIGITCFFIIEIILDPVIWVKNWVLLPYFFYYIAIGVFYFLKR
ncbi:MAG: hypothetical protein ACTSO9_11975 [Candidatus Helarchaeota archaeon]